MLVQSARGLPRLHDLTQTRETDRRVTREWILEDHAEADPGLARPLLMGHFLAPAHYGKGEMAYLPWAEEEEALQFVGRIAPDYIVLRKTERRWTLYGAKWLTEGIAHPCAEPVTLPAEANPYQVWRWNCGR
jgi:hypothetical protein